MPRWLMKESAARMGTKVPGKDAMLHHVAEGIARINLYKPQAPNAIDPGLVAKRAEIPGLGDRRPAVGGMA